MSEKEIEKLEDFIAEKVMGFTKADILTDKESVYFHPFTRPEDAMRVLEKCAEKDIVEINKCGELWKVRGLTMPGASGRADTLPLAICRLAKQLFQK